MSMSTADRISELPEAILHHILSFLSIKDVASTSILSKWWNKVWNTHPYLNFNDESFMNSNSDNPKQIGKNRDLLAVVQRIARIREQHMSIEKFSLFVPPWKDEHVSTWRYGLLSEEEREERKREIGLSSFSVINYVATPFLRELELVNGITMGPQLWLPPSLVSAKWLTALTLKGFDLCSSWSSLDISFICLQKVDIEYVILDDNIIKNLITGSSSSLKILELRKCFALNTIHLVGKFDKLKRLRVEFPPKGLVLEVYDAPEFEDLHIFSWFQSWNSYCNFNLKNCPRMKKIILDCNFTTENNLTSFEHLEELKIWNCGDLNYMNIFSNSLKTLSLYNLDNLSHLHIFSPILESLTFSALLTKFDQFPDLISLDNSTGMLREIKLIMTEFDIKWVKFLQYFKHTKIVTIKCNKLAIIPADMRNQLKLLSPLLGTRDISYLKQFCRVSKLVKMTITELVEYLLWLAPRAESVTIISFKKITLLSLELVYHEEEEKKKNFSCSYCKSLPIDCWRHCLKEVRIHKFVECRYHLAKMKNFFLKEVKDLQIVNNVIYKTLVDRMRIKFGRVHNWMLRS